MSFSDDEPPPTLNSSAGKNQVGDRVRLVAYSNDKAPLEENTQQVLLEITDTSYPGERLGLDLVAVLDISGSMYGKKLDKLKMAMKFVISKLRPMDRLSIVSFASDAIKQCPLRLMTDDGKENINDIVENKLSAAGSTNMSDGLKMALDILDDRQHKNGRVSSIVLMSDGDEDFPGASLAVDARGKAVYTFGFGENHDAKVLGAIASKSRGGTFLYVRDEESLTVRFAEILAGLLSVVIQELELAMWEQPRHSKIIVQEKDDGNATDPGRYLQRRQGDKVCISFGDLFSGEVRKVIVHLLLPAVHIGYRATVMAAQCSYSIQGQPFISPRVPLRCFIHRIRSANPDAKNPKVEEEEDRLFYVDKIDEASKTNDYDRAHGKLEETQEVLDGKRPNRTIAIVKNELQELLKAKTWKDLLASLLATKVSHDRQRGGPLFSTPRMRRNMEQADRFEQDPNELPPSVDDDDKEEEAEVAATRPVLDQPREPRLLRRPWERRSSRWWAWAMVVLCTMLAICVIVAGVVVFAVYIFFKPKMPYLAISDAQLVLLQYDQGGTIQSLQMSITVRAENNNSKADATFSRVDLAVGFNGADVVLLQAEPFVVARESSLPLRYNVAVAPGPALDKAGMQAMDESLKAGVVPFDLFGKARTRWKVGVFVKLRYWTRISCRLRFFFPGNGTVMPTDRDRCRSK